jgi:ABC-type methionine transport system ATPase subunit
MEQPSEGKILIDGVDVHSLNKKERRHQQQKMGMIFQNYNLLENLRVADNVALPLKLQKKKETDKSIDYWNLLECLIKLRLIQSNFQGERNNAYRLLER